MINLFFTFRHDLLIRNSGSLYLSKITGEPISESEARTIVCRFGVLEKVWYCSPTEKEMFRLPEGIWVMFAFFQDCRDAQSVNAPQIFLNYY